MDQKFSNIISAESYSNSSKENVNKMVVKSKSIVELLTKDDIKRLSDNDMIEDVQSEFAEAHDVFPLINARDQVTNHVIRGESVAERHAVAPHAGGMPLGNTLAAVQGAIGRDRRGRGRSCHNARSLKAHASAAAPRGRACRDRPRA